MYFPYNVFQTERKESDVKRAILKWHCVLYGLESWIGVLEWSLGVSWNGVIEWLLGVETWSKILACDRKLVSGNKISFGGNGDHHKIGNKCINFTSNRQVTEIKGKQTQISIQETAYAFVKHFAMASFTRRQISQPELSFQFQFHSKISLQGSLHNSTPRLKSMTPVHKIHIAI